MRMNAATDYSRLCSRGVRKPDKYGGSLHCGLYPLMQCLPVHQALGACMQTNPIHTLTRTPQHTRMHAHARTHLLARRHRLHTSTCTACPHAHVHAHRRGLSDAFHGCYVVCIRGRPSNANETSGVAAKTTSTSTSTADSRGKHNP
jgi:hypothetical protein